MAIKGKGAFFRDGNPQRCGKLFWKKQGGRRGSNFQGKTFTFVENEVDPGGRAVETKSHKKANKRSLNP